MCQPRNHVVASRWRWYDFPVAEELRHSRLRRFLPRVLRCRRRIRNWGNFFVFPEAGRDWVRGNLGVGGRVLQQDLLHLMFEMNKMSSIKAKVLLIKTRQYGNNINNLVHHSTGCVLCFDNYNLSMFYRARYLKFSTNELQNYRIWYSDETNLKDYIAFIN